jgi:hypothetical protein
VRLARQLSRGLRHLRVGRVINFWSKGHGFESLQSF